MVAISQSSTASTRSSDGASTTLSYLKSLCTSVAPLSLGRCSSTHAPSFSDRRHVVGARLAPALGPTAHLALHVSFRLTEIAEAYRSPVERVDLREGVARLFGYSPQRRAESRFSPSGTRARRMTPRTRSIT